MSETAATPELLALDRPPPPSVSVLERVTLQSERLAETLRASVRRWLRWSCEVGFTAPRTRRIGDLAAFACGRAFWHGSRRDDAPPSARWDVLLGVEPALVHAAIDRSLGGPGETAVPSRAPTELELELGRDFVGRLHAALADALAAPPLQFATSAPGTILEPLQTWVEDVHEAALELPIRIETQAGCHELRLVLRANSLAPDAVEPIPEASLAGAPPALAQGELEVEVEVARCRLTLDELRGLAPGDVVLFDVPTGAPVELRVQDEAKARGRLGVAGGHYAVEIHELLGERVPDNEGGDPR